MFTPIPTPSSPSPSEEDEEEEEDDFSACTEEGEEEEVGFVNVKAVPSKPLQTMTALWASTAADTQAEKKWNRRNRVFESTSPLLVGAGV